MKKILYFEELGNEEISDLALIFDAIGITDYSFDEKTATVSIDTTLSDDDILDALEDDGFDVDGIVGGM